LSHAGPNALRKKRGKARATALLAELTSKNRGGRKMVPPEGSEKKNAPLDTEPGSKNVAPSLDWAERRSCAVCPGGSITGRCKDEKNEWVLGGRKLHQPTGTLMCGERGNEGTRIGGKAAQEKIPFRESGEARKKGGERLWGA